MLIVSLSVQDSLARHEEEMNNPVQFLEFIPEEFRGLIQNFDAQQLHSAFPNVHNYRERSRWGEVDYQWREYLGPALFMERFRGYNFTFIVEHDVRYTGKHWGKFLNSCMQIGSRALGHKSRLPVREGSTIAKKRQHDPDFIIFSPDLIHPVTVVDNPGDLMDNTSWHYPNTLKYFTMMYGMSRKFNQYIVEQSEKGNGGFSEQFLPSVALHEDVKAVSTSLGVWEDSHPLHCCMPQITAIYDNWYLSGKHLCSLLLHPVKNINESVWTDNDELQSL